MATGFDLSIRQNDTTPVFSDTIKDSTGAVQNLTGATVKFIMRSLTAAATQVNATATVTDAVNGKVTYNWVAADTATAGLFQAVFRVTLSGGGTYTFPNDGYYEIWVEEDLTTSTAQMLVGLGDAKNFLNIAASDRSQDQKLTRFIRAVTPLIQEVTGPIIAAQYDETYDGGHTMISPRHRPVITLIAVSEFIGPVEYPLSIVQDPAHGSVYSCMIDPTGRRIVRRGPGGSTQPFFPGADTVHVVYTAGRASVPENVRQATLEAIRENFQQTQQGGRPSLNASAVVDAPGPSDVFLSDRVRQMLVPNRRHPSIA